VGSAAPREHEVHEGHEGHEKIRSYEFLESAGFVTFVDFVDFVFADAGSTRMLFSIPPMKDNVHELPRQAQRSHS